MCSDTLPNSSGKEGGPPRLCAGADGRYGTADDAPQVYLGRSVPPREYVVQRQPHALQPASTSSR